MLAKAILVHGVIGYKFCWLLPEDHNQGTPAGHESNGTSVRDYWEDMNLLRHQLGTNRYTIDWYGQKVSQMVLLILVAYLFALNLFMIFPTSPSPLKDHEMWLYLISILYVCSLLIFSVLHYACFCSFLLIFWWLFYKRFIWVEILGG